MITQRNSEPSSTKCDSSGVVPLTDGITYADNTTKANMLNDQFSSNFNKNKTVISMKDMGRSPHPKLPKINIAPVGVKNLLCDFQIRVAGHTAPISLP
ncbi:LOW QUALITY PROTEIN: hypothetical protein MAR_037851 [Mya arenaria]|uniref:Uncharacterized protein n=1 Tax=Mya arenaria TaxID=6604 RepID=A0ABY7FRH4_MYAAR|nr:LOW QUALITY PROTEIN: hypothetical protein MAR_037851 [Mya arenaria]